MGKVSNYINPLTTPRVLKYLGLAIDETKLVRTINIILDQVKYTSAAQLESGRKHYLVSELRFLNKRLRSVRKKANIQ